MSALRPLTRTLLRPHTCPLSSLHLRCFSIQTSTIPTHPSSLKFHPSMPVLDPNIHPTSMEFHAKKGTQSSPLAQRLFTIPGISAVEYGPDYITLSKTSSTGWDEIKPEAEKMMAEALEGEGAGIVAEEHGKGNIRGEGNEVIIEAYGARKGTV